VSSAQSAKRFKYLIAILDFKLEDSDPGTYLQDIRLVNTRNGKVFYDKTVYKFLELTSFDKQEEYLVNNIDKWVFLLKNMHHLHTPPKFIDEGVFKKVFNVAVMSKLTKEERMLYERDSIRKSDYEGGFAYAREQAFNEGELKGELKKSYEFAREMKSDGFSTSQILKYTKLTTEAIENL